VLALLPVLPSPMGALLGDAENTLLQQLSPLWKFGSGGAGGVGEAAAAGVEVGCSPWRDLQRGAKTQLQPLGRLKLSLSILC